MNIEEVKKLLAETKGRENKNFKYAFWLGYVLGTDYLEPYQKELKLKEMLRKKGKIRD